MQEGWWMTVTPSQFAHEREALAHVVDRVTARFPELHPLPGHPKLDRLLPAMLPKLDDAMVRVGDNDWFPLPDTWVVNAHRSSPAAS
ncbi:hypothetical protein [Micromonospora sp. WMMC250]|uniref:hypothetical protein n=1 Tax=Micromonospora sp. WMMC250 TaxID=3014781 RepID=UPI0022B6F4E0|nr:hypothetical protein [Micromonospora sp. WMMC250]MCZ7374618.1 hypothetical protein [Micromonospora sp. WMMC250]